MMSWHNWLWWSSLATILSACLSLLIGHTGDHNFAWMHNHISTYAARAPRGEWVTLSMRLFALTAPGLGLLLSLTGQLRNKALAHVASMFCGASAAGMELLARYPEVMVFGSRGHISPTEARLQAFHDAGVLIFFTCALAATFVSGIAFVLHSNTVVTRTVGAMLAGLPWLTVNMDRNWPRRVFGDHVGDALGMRQRAMFTLLGLGFLCLLGLLRPSVAHKRHSE
mmetsp:Transcript_59061/g.139009  ORF Transcript_59061/g.139009 Transcript_59061/m.139009 type:complete len:225 (+) Transcript_59061:3-677(+)